MIKKTILLTGATGFLGSELLKNLLKEGYEIVLLKRSFSNINRISSELNLCKYYDIDLVPLSNVFIENKIDIVINTATSYGRNEDSIEKIILSNYTFPISLIQLASKYNVGLFINTSSTLSAFTNEYSLTKTHFEDWLKFYKNNICIVNLYLEYFFGPGDDDWKFISMVLNKLAIESNNIDLTAGNQQRNFIYIEDVINAYSTILKKNFEANKIHHFKVATNELYTIKQVAEFCKVISKNNVTKLKFGVLPSRVSEVRVLNEEVEDLINTGWVPVNNLKIGLEKTWNFIKNKKI